MARHQKKDQKNEQSSLSKNLINQIALAGTSIVCQRKKCKKNVKILIWNYSKLEKFCYLCNVKR